MRGFILGVVDTSLVAPLERQTQNWTEAFPLKRSKSGAVLRQFHGSNSAPIRGGRRFQLLVP